MLPESRARTILEAWRRTAQLAEVTLECTRPTLDTRAPRCTAIVFVLEQPSPKVASVREALLVWIAVSRCRGFSLQDNFRFWKSVCGRCVSAETLTDRAEGNHRVLEFCSEAIEVVLHWRGRPSSLLRQVMNSCFLRQASPSVGAMDVLHELARFSDEANQLVIECSVRVGPRASTKDTRELVAIAADVAMKIRKGKIKALGAALPVICLVGLECIQGSCAADQEMELFESFLASLPDGIIPSIRFRVIGNPHRDTSGVHEHQGPSMLAFGHFLIAAIGNIKEKDSPGTLMSLDFSRTCLQWNPDMSCLGSLLPYAVSLREVCVNPRNTLDWMWLLYSVFHPSSKQLGLMTRLSVRACKATSANWETLRVFYERGCSVLDLFCFSQETPWSPQIDQPFVRIVRTAIATLETPVLLLDGSRLRIYPGCFVEVCDAQTPLDSMPSEVDVLVPGFGFARIPRKSIEFLTDRLLHGAPKSCVSCLEMMHVPKGASVLIRILGGSLKVLRMHPPVVSLSELVTWSLNLDSVDYVSVSEIDTCTQLAGLSTISHLGINVDEDTVDNALQLLECARSHGLVALRSIRVDGVNEARQIEAVVSKCGWLRYLEASTRKDPASSTKEISNLCFQTRGTHLRRRFAAFMSVVMNADDSHPVTSLDARIIRLIVELTAPLLETVFIDGKSFSAKET